MRFEDVSFKTVPSSVIYIKNTVWRLLLIMLAFFLKLHTNIFIQ